MSGLDSEHQNHDGSIKKIRKVIMGCTPPGAVSCLVLDVTHKDKVHQANPLRHAQEMQRAGPSDVARQSSGGEWH